MEKILIPIGLIAAIGFLVWNYFPASSSAEFTSDEKALVYSLSLSNLSSLPEDPSNKIADNESAAEFGHALFYDTRLSGNGLVACATCHQPEVNFTDGLPLAVGTDIGPRHTPSLVGIAYSPWFYWDGRKDSQWSQALAPLEASHEHNIDRLSLAKLILEDEKYQQLYKQLFGNIPNLSHLNEPASPLGTEAQIAQWIQLEESERITINTVYSNLGKSLAAFQRKLMPGRSRFDDFADAITEVSADVKTDYLSNSEIAGLKLFVGKAQCATCHNGPLFSNHEFHNTGVQPNPGELPPMARYDGIREARNDPFNCLGKFSDATASQCTELRFARDSNDLVGAQKTPTLRNIAETAPYMHGGQQKSLAEVVSHYNEAPTSMLSHNEAKPLGLRSIEMQQLEAFLRTLSAPLATDPKWLKPPTPEL